MKQTVKPRVIIGLSGGVDSSVAALLLIEEGYKVIGLFMKNYSDTKNKITGECSWIEERKMAQKVAAQLGIRLITVDYEQEYKKHVIDPMYQAYAKNKTPNPDVLCNTVIKFPVLRKHAKQLGATHIATGHYARVHRTKKGSILMQGIDEHKDQSYFLYELNQEDLEHTFFPIGEKTKEEVRAIAWQHHFPNWNKKGTRGICFIGKMDMKAFLKKKIKEKQGVVRDTEGNKIGTHPGTMYFTIGERIGEKKGFTITKERRGARWYVAEKKRNNTLIIAPEGHPALTRNTVLIHHFHILMPGRTPRTGLRARVRHLGELHHGTLKKTHGTWQFTFKKNISGLAAGQAIVLYKGKKVIGGGEIHIP